MQVFTSASSTVFKTYACDENVVDGKNYLRADYSISCETSLHMFVKVYAGLMILVSRHLGQQWTRQHPLFWW